MLHKFFVKFLILAYLLIKYNYAQRIIGGQPAANGQFPFAAAINITTQERSYFCGGTLLNRNWVITAGQCVYRATSVTFHLGSIYLTTVDPFRQRWPSSQFVVHPDFNPDTLENDIGLIKLLIPLQVVTSRISPISALPLNEFEADSAGIAIGWGQLSDDSDLIEELQYVGVNALSNAECRITFSAQLKDTMLCARGDNNEGTCIGDTGSPLVEPTERGNGRLVAIASFVSGNGCESTDPSGYIRIFPYLSWIRNITA